MPRKGMTTVQTQNLHRKIAATQKIAELAKELAGNELGAAFVDVVVELTPKDTNRLANAWIDAGRTAGVTDMPLLPLIKSSRHQEYLDQLQDEMLGFAKEIGKADSWMKKYEGDDLENPFKKNGKPRKKRTRQKFYRTQKRIKAKAEKRLDRVIQEYEKAIGSEHAIFFNREDLVQRKSNRAFSTVRDTVYGGSGRTYFDGAKLIVELISHEPHGWIVEKHPHLGHPVTTARQLMKSAGIKTVSRTYIKELVKRSPLANHRAA